MPLIIFLACILGFFSSNPICRSQVIWSPLADLPPIAALDLEAATLVTFTITQPFEGAGLRALYLVEKVCYQLVVADTLQVLMDPSEFMFTPLSMTNAEYRLWRNGIPYAQWVSDELDYDKFNNTQLMSSLTLAVHASFLLIHYSLFFTLL